MATCSPIQRAALRVSIHQQHAAAARARQNEYADLLPEEHWDQRNEAPSPPPERPAWQSARPSSARQPSTRLSSTSSRARPAAAARDERVVDYSAFDDVASRPAASASAAAGAGRAIAGGLARGTRVFHRRFGSGIVEQCEGPDKVVARFKGFGPKKVLLEYLTFKE